MLVVIMAMAVVVETLPTHDPAKLVNQLGSPRYAARESAEVELIRLGRRALPTLREARDSPDAEIRARSVALISRIENSSMLESTPIIVDLRDVTLGRTLDAINAQSETPLALLPEEKSLLDGRRITLRTNGPLPFWKVIDLLELSANVHSIQVGLASQDSRGIVGMLTLADGLAVRRAPIHDCGPFRVQLSSVHCRSEIQFGDLTPDNEGRGASSDLGTEVSGPAGRPSREFFIQMSVTAEPRLSITRNGPVKVTTAVDDRGQTLANQAAQVNFQHTAGFFGISPSPTLRIQTDLGLPDSPGRRIRLLRGSIPVVVATRRPSPVVLPLVEGLAGKTLRSERFALTLIDHRPAFANQPAAIQLKVRPLAVQAEPANIGMGEPLGYRPDSSQYQLEILDAQGRPLSWFPSGTFSDGEQTRCVMTIPARDALGTPAAIRFHEIARANADVAFEFRDIPIP